MTLPAVSVVIVGRNCEHMLPACLDALTTQVYPKEKLEIVFVDGNSTDKSRIIAQQYGARTLEGGFPNNAEARRYVGIKAAKYDIVAFIDTDNILPHKNWLQDMVEPFHKCPEIIGAFTKWYGYSEMTSRLDQYYALVGGNDPIVYYLGKNDRVPYLRDQLPYGAQLLVDKGNFELVSFCSEKIPTLGCNGFLFRRTALATDYADFNHFLHIDIHVDIIKKMQQDNVYAIVKNTILHHTGETITKNLRKRMSYMNIHYLGFSHARRYKVFDSTSLRDKIHLFKCILFAMTFIQPLWVSYRGWRRTGNFNWFYHPVVTFLLTTSYSINVIRGVCICKFKKFVTK